MRNFNGGLKIEDFGGGGTQRDGLVSISVPRWLQMLEVRKGTKEVLPSKPGMSAHTAPLVS